jgi:hypothetical protein
MTSSGHEHDPGTRMTGKGTAVSAVPSPARCTGVIQAVIQGILVRGPNGSDANTSMR